MGPIPFSSGLRPSGVEAPEIVVPPVPAKNSVRIDVIDVGSLPLISFPLPCLPSSFPSWALSTSASQPGWLCSWRFLPYATRSTYFEGRSVGAFDLDASRNTWRTEEATAKAMNLEDVKDAIGKQSALFAELLGSCSDADLRAEIEMFGRRASRGSMIVGLVLCHYAAYRMQSFLYLKACGREELNTMNLWAGMDAA